MARRSITSEGLSVGAPCTCERKPSSLYLAAWVMPDLASCRLDNTSWVLFPMDETMPIPVMTTRLMLASPRPVPFYVYLRGAFVQDGAVPCLNSPTLRSLAR